MLGTVERGSTALLPITSLRKANHVVLDIVETSVGFNSLDKTTPWYRSSNTARRSTARS